MLNKTLLLFILIFLSGCVERGYELTVNPTTQTVTAIKSVDIRNDIKTSTQSDIDKMNTVVIKKQKAKTTAKKNQEEIAQEEIAQRKLEAKKKLEKEKARQAQDERDALLKKQTIEREKQEALAEKERKILANKVEAEKIEQTKEIAKIKATQIENERIALQKKLALDKAKRERQEKEENLALERKIAQDQKIQAQKDQIKKEALERKLLKEKKIAVALRAKEDAKRAKNTQEEKQASKGEERKSVVSTESLIFKPSTKTYQKFGTSEIHGHVVYMTPGGQETRLKNTKIYLVPESRKVSYWYENYYLKNKEASSLSKTVVNYINATHLNLEKNFAFYGLATGTYYVIIESTQPLTSAKNNKIYIAKKINVEKYKKIMTVFSKKL